LRSKDASLAIAGTAARARIAAANANRFIMFLDSLLVPGSGAGVRIQMIGSRFGAFDLVSFMVAR
jgi:hypothetical protein